MIFEERLEILFNRKVAAETYCLGLKGPEIARAARAGQFLMIKVAPGNAPLLRRPFSIAGIVDDTVHLIYRVVGKGTALLAETGEGRKLSVLGPLGKGFFTDMPGHRYLLVAGGIGVAPLYFLSRALEGADVEFMMGFRSSAETFVYEPLLGSGLKITLATDDGSRGYAGPVTGLLEQYFDAVVDKPVAVFTCGPKPMLRQVARMCMDRRIACQASLETYMGCGLGACLGCAVKTPAGEQDQYLYACKDGPVFSVELIDWNDY
ncbi:MAG: dihydroorotate dehydrogenase electron transfer subunit [Deltaproteobacteria bacterium]|nr:dihydroorotate dehydrogenase electron transfer subunit [Deltaproteobacteria bacterium]